MPDKTYSSAEAAEHAADAWFGKIKTGTGREVAVVIGEYEPGVWRVTWKNPVDGIWRVVGH